MRGKGKVLQKCCETNHVVWFESCWTVNKKIEQIMNVVEMRILKWISRVPKKDMMRNKYIRDSIGVTSIVDKMRENILS